MKVKMKAVEWHVQLVRHSNKCQMMCVCVLWTYTSLNFQIIQRRKDRVRSECAQVVVTMIREKERETT